jgi:gas vesicle protein
MDAGDAAVIGAAIGAMGGLGGGLVTFPSQGRQLRVQAQLDRTRWRDELRRDAYNARIASSKQLSAAWWKVSDQLLDERATNDDWQASFVVAHGAWHQFSAAVSAVVVAGPRSVVEAADSLGRSLYERDMAGLSWFRAAEREGVGRIAECETRFKTVASAKRGPERAFQQAARKAPDTEHQLVSDKESRPRRRPIA